MHIAEVDHIANNGYSIFHQAKPSVKLLLNVVILALLIFSTNLYLIGGLLIVIFLLYVLAGISLIRIGHLALYPTFFSVLFAVIISQGVWQAALLIIMRALGTALTLIFLFATTPYIDLFSCLYCFMPNILGDLFLFTYRGVFILLYKCTNLIRIVKMRGGFRPQYLLYDFRNTAGILGLLFIHSFAVSERMYQVFSLRGYEGGIPHGYNVTNWQYPDYLVLSLTIIIVIVAVMV